MLAAESSQAVERALQDIDGGVLIDDGGAFLSAHIGGDQRAFDRGGRQTLVPERDRQIGCVINPGEDAQSTSPIIPISVGRAD